MPRNSDLRYTFEPTSGTPFEVVAFTLQEGLSQPFHLDIQLSSDNPNVNFGAVLDRPALFTIWRGEQPVRRVHGLISLFNQGDTGFRRTRYRAVVEPTLARAGLRSNWRIFQQQSVPQIIDAVLKAQSLTDREQLVGAAHEPREYCVQVGETDLAFLARLAAEEGLLYNFVHRADGHRLIYTDKVQNLGAIGRKENCQVLYQPTPGGDQPEPALRRFDYTEQVRTARQVQRDYTFKHSSYAQEHVAESRDHEHQQRDYERFDYPGRYKRDEAGKPFTKTRLAALRRDARIATVKGDDARLQPGLAFDLIGHPREELNIRWRPVFIEHYGTQLTSLEEEAAGSEQSTTYHQTAELVTGLTDWKAELRDKPRIDGPHMATVVGPPGEEIYCDEWGRIKVSFPWDRASQSDEHSSCWIRVSQGWAGTTWGAMAIPRIGQEVLVEYLDGDGDQPIVSGRTYRADNLPPYPLPQHKTRMTIKSQTHKGEGFNELRFEDEKDQEEIYLHAQKDQNTEIKNNQTTFVGNDRSEQVEHDECIEIGNDRSEQVGHDEQVTVGHDRRHEVGQDEFLAIGRSQTIQIDQDRSESVGNHRQDKTAANHWIETGGSVEHSVQGHFQITTGQGIEQKTRTYQMQAGQRIVLQGPGGTITIDNRGITLDAIAVHIKGPVSTPPQGVGNTLAISGSPATGEPICVSCWLKAAQERKAITQVNA